MSTSRFEFTVPDLLMRLPAISRVELRGSRARGTARRFSDWDFVVATSDFDAVAAELPVIVEPLHPLVHQWDRLSGSKCYMLILAGPTKIDLIFEGVENRHEPPWVVAAQTLQGVDDHFWDWSLWLASKVDADKHELVAAELAKMHAHILGPMDATGAPRSLPAAAASYLAARTNWESRLGVSVRRDAGDAVQHVIAQL